MYAKLACWRCECGAKWCVTQIAGSRLRDLWRKSSSINRRNSSGAGGSRWRSSVKSHSAINVQSLPGNRGRFVGSEKQGGIGNFLFCLWPTLQDSIEHLGHKFVGRGLEALDQAS